MIETLSLTTLVFIHSDIAVEVWQSWGSPGSHVPTSSTEHASAPGVNTTVDVIRDFLVLLVVKVVSYDKR